MPTLAAVQSSCAFASPHHLDQEEAGSEGQDPGKATGDQDGFGPGAVMVIMVMVVARAPSPGCPSTRTRSTSCAASA